MKQVIVLIILLIGGSFSLNDEYCGEGCLSCQDKHCLYCWKRPMDQDNDAICSKDVAPDKFHCDMWSSFNVCEWCETGYSSELIFPVEGDQLPKERILQTEGVCRKGTNPGCKYTGWYIGYNMCFVCIKGFPSEDNHVCNPYSGE